MRLNLKTTVLFVSKIRGLRDFLSKLIPSSLSILLVTLIVISSFHSGYSQPDRVVNRGTMVVPGNCEFNDVLKSMYKQFRDTGNKEYPQATVNNCFAPNRPEITFYMRIWGCHGTRYEGTDPKLYKMIFEHLANAPSIKSLIIENKLSGTCDGGSQVLQIEGIGTSDANPGLRLWEQMKNNKVIRKFIKNLNQGGNNPGPWISYGGRKNICADDNEDIMFSDKNSCYVNWQKKVPNCTTPEKFFSRTCPEGGSYNKHIFPDNVVWGSWAHQFQINIGDSSIQPADYGDPIFPQKSFEILIKPVMRAPGDATGELLDAKGISVNDISITGGEDFQKTVSSRLDGSIFAITLTTQMDRDDPNLLARAEDKMLSTNFTVTLALSNPERMKTYSFVPRKRIFYDSQNEKIDPPEATNLPQLLEVGWAPPSNIKTVILSIVDEEGKAYKDTDFLAEGGKIFALIDPNKTQEEKRQCLNIQSFSQSRLFFERIGVNQIALHFRNHNATDKGKPANINETDFSDIMNPVRNFKDVNTAGMINKVDDWKTDFKACNRFTILNRKFKVGGTNPDFTFETTEPAGFSVNRLVVRKPVPMVNRKIYFQPGSVVNNNWQAQTLNILKEVTLAGGVPGMEVQFDEAGTDTNGKKVYMAEILVPEAGQSSFAQANLQFQIYPGHASKSAEYRFTPGQTDVQIVVKDSNGVEITPEFFTTNDNISTRYYKLLAPSGTSSTTHVQFYLVDQNGKELTESELQGFPLISNVDQAIKRKCLQPGNSVTTAWTASEINFEKESGNKIVAWFSQKNKPSVIRSLNSYEINRTKGYPVMYGTAENFGMAASCGGFSIKPGANIFIKPFGNSTKYGIVFENTGSNNLTVVKPVDFTKIPISLKISFKDISAQPHKLNPDGLKIILENADLKYKAERVISGNNDLIFSGVTLSNAPDTDSPVKKYSLRGYKVKVVTSLFGSSDNSEDYRFLVSGKKTVEINLTDIVPDSSAVISDFTAKFTDASETDRMKMYLTPPALDLVPKKSKIVAFAIEKAKAQNAEQAADGIDISKDCLKFFSDEGATTPVSINYEKLSGNNYLMKFATEIGTQSSGIYKFYIKTPKAADCSGFQAQQLIWENEKPVSELQSFQAKYASEIVLAQVNFDDENSPVSFMPVGSTSEPQVGVLRLYKNELFKFQFLVKDKFSGKLECEDAACKESDEGMSLILQDEQGKKADFAISEMISPDKTMLVYLDTLSGYTGKYKLSIASDGTMAADYLYYFDNKFVEAKQENGKTTIILSDDFKPDEASDYKLAENTPQLIEVSRLHKRARESLDIRVMGKVNRSDTYKLIGNNNITLDLKSGGKGIFLPNTYFERVSGETNLEKYRNQWAKARYTYEIKVNGVVKNESKEGYAWIKENGTPCIGKKDFSSYKVVACGRLSLRDKPNGGFLKNSLGADIILNANKDDHSIYLLENVVPPNFVMKPVINQHYNKVTTSMIVETDNPQNYITAAPYKVEWPYDHDVKDGKYTLCMVESESKTGCGLTNVSITGISSGGSEFIEGKSSAKSEFTIKMQSYVNWLKEEGKTDYANGKVFYMAMDLPYLSRDANIKITKDEESGAWQLAGGGNVIYVTENGVEIPGNNAGPGLISAESMAEIGKNVVQSQHTQFWKDVTRILNEKTLYKAARENAGKNGVLIADKDGGDFWRYSGSAGSEKLYDGEPRKVYRFNDVTYFGQEIASRGCPIISNYALEVSMGYYTNDAEGFALFMFEQQRKENDQICSWGCGGRVDNRPPERRSGGSVEAIPEEYVSPVALANGVAKGQKGAWVGDVAIKSDLPSKMSPVFENAKGFYLHMGNGSVQNSQTHWMPISKAKSGWVVWDFNSASLSADDPKSKWYRWLNSGCSAKLTAEGGGVNIGTGTNAAKALQCLFETHRKDETGTVKSDAYMHVQMVK